MHVNMMCSDGEWDACVCVCVCVCVCWDRAQCKEIYAFTFQFALDQGQKCLPVEMCVEFWKLLLKDHFVLLDKWIAFVEARCKNAISKDTWMMLYDLATQVKPDLSDYDVNGAWPVLLDEFVEQVKEQKI